MITVATQVQAHFPQTTNFIVLKKLLKRARVLIPIAIIRRYRRKTQAILSTQEKPSKDPVSYMATHL